MRALVVGYGSIGARHARILEEEGCAVGTVSRRPVPVRRRYSTLQEGLDQHDPEYVVIANRTAEHGGALRALSAAAFSGRVLVEKPLFAGCEPVPENGFERLLVAYNLRFHPTLLALRRELVGHRVLSVQAYAGQYLPSWRPGRDYRTGYSADRNQGGGVLRDLSHEFDYLGWLFGRWSRATALGGHLSTLDIQSEDVAVVLASYHRCPAVSVHLNYVDRPGRRHMVVNTDDATFEIDLTLGRLSVGGDRTSFEVDRDATYRAQHRAILDGQDEDVCTAVEALDTLALIQAAEASLTQPQWTAR